MSENKINATIHHLKKIVAFSNLDDTEMADLVKYSEVLEYSDLDIIIAEGDKSDYFYGIISGSAVVTVNKTDNDGTYICALGEGEVFGEAAIVQDIKRTANVLSSGATTIFRIQRKNLIAFLKSKPRGGIITLLLIVFSLLKKLREANQELAYERKDDADQNEIDSIIDAFNKA